MFPSIRLLLSKTEAERYVKWRRISCPIEIPGGRRVAREFGSRLSPRPAVVCLRPERKACARRPGLCLVTIRLCRHADTVAKSCAPHPELFSVHPASCPWIRFAPQITPSDCLAHSGEPGWDESGSP